MRTTTRTFLLIALCTIAVACAGCQSRPDTTASDALARSAHEAYVSAINSNNVDTLLAMLTDDVVYQAPNAAEIVGKAAVRTWLEGYLSAYSTHWEKASLEFIVAGDWAFERYTYKSTDTPKAGGEPLHDTGKGINIYHHDADGRWRLARDGWSSDVPLPTP